MRQFKIPHIRGNSILDRSFQVRIKKTFLQFWITVQQHFIQTGIKLFVRNSKDVGYLLIHQFKFFVTLAL